MLPIDTNIKEAYASGMNAEQQFIQDLVINCFIFRTKIFKFTIFVFVFALRIVRFHNKIVSNFVKVHGCQYLLYNLFDWSS